MVLRFLARYFFNNTDLIERMANSRIMRRAAQMTIYLFHRSKSALEDKGAIEFKEKVESFVKDQNTTGRLKKFKNNFTNEFRKEWEKARGGGPSKQP